MTKTEQIQAIEKIINDNQKISGIKPNIPKGCSGTLNTKELATAIEEAIGVDESNTLKIFREEYKKALTIYTVGDMLNDEFSCLAKAISTNKDVIKIQNKQI